MNTVSFKHIFLPYHEKLYRIAFRLLRDEAQAKDMVQETYVKLWNKRSELHKIENTEGFAIVILKNTCLDYLRKPIKDIVSTSDVEIEETDNTIHSLELTENIANIKKMVSKLPEQQRLVIELKHWDELTDEEIEKATGISLGNIRVLLSRGRKKIKEQYLKFIDNENRRIKAVN